MSKEFKIKNAYIGPFCAWLNDLYLEPRRSRVRTKFISILSNHLNEDVQKERNEIIQEYTVKDKEGNPSLIIDASGRTLYDVPNDKSAEMNKKYDSLLNRDYVIEIDDTNSEMFREIKEVVLEPEYRFGPRDGEPQNVKEARVRLANSYNEWCRSFDVLEFD